MQPSCLATALPRTGNLPLSEYPGTSFVKSEIRKKTRRFDFFSFLKPLCSSPFLYVEILRLGFGQRSAVCLFFYIVNCIKRAAVNDSSKRRPCSLSHWRAAGRFRGVRRPQAAAAVVALVGRAEGGRRTNDG